MDPMNNPTPNPTPTPEPGPAPTPMPGPEPAASPEPSPAPIPESMQTPNPVPSPVPPVNSAPAPGVTPSFQPTDPIMRPEPAKAPDPIEEELKAPMKAADPVPGSIGSAVSGPNEDGPAQSAAMNFGPEPAVQTPSVPFNDPATQPEATDGGQPTKPKAKTNKKTLIALIIVAAMVVIALVAVLVMQLVNGDNSSSPSNSSASNSSSASNNSNSTPPNNTDIDGGDNTNTNNNTVPAATIGIVCTASYVENGNTVNQNIDFRVENNVLTGATVEVSITDADGNMDNTSQTLTFEEMIGDAAIIGEDDALLGTNGELLVPVNTLSDELESALNVSGDMTYACVIN